MDSITEYDMFSGLERVSVALDSMKGKHCG